MSREAEVVLTSIASRILEIRSANSDRHTLVGIDGVDGSGKTTFAGNLLEVLGMEIDRKYLHVISIDDFHNLRKVRYRQGKSSPRGFFEDSFDYFSFTERVLNPIGESNGHSVSIVGASHDHSNDQLISPPPIILERQSIVIVEGIFLHRDELIGRFDFSIFLDVPFYQSVARMAERDGTSPDPDDPSVRRYVDGQLIYFEECSPKNRATLVVDNSN